MNRNAGNECIVTTRMNECNAREMVVGNEIAGRMERMKWTRVDHQVE